jgi:diaminohydroxyphosphoribosylaminopyrimidine deaminase / 5-amino-6-(5-phosphoribosylamino)uracil reductase
MQRCIALAQLGAGNVAPNPMVGAVLVYEHKIIGEGYHQKYGEAHAEVNCINAVSEEHKKDIEKSTLYVSLEPCAHHGKTPPCVDLILRYKIKHVVIGCRDSFKKVNSTGISILENAGVKVELTLLQHECRNLNKYFFTYHEKKRPYIILKWAQTNNGFIAEQNGKPIQISNDYTNKYVHKLRSEVSAILVGKNTVLNDNPALTTRLWQGKNPVRFVLDGSLELDNSFKIFNNEAQTICINNLKNKVQGSNIFIKKEESETIIEKLISYCNLHNLNSIIIEGGAKTIQYFIDAKQWDEAIVITNTAMQNNSGISSPKLQNELFLYSEIILNDCIAFFKQNQNEFL